MSTAHLEPFTSETAKLAAAKSVEVRQAKLLERARIYHEAQTAAIPSEAQLETQRQIRLTQEQIARTRSRLNDADIDYCEECERGGLRDKDRASLLRELRGMMEHLCRLRGIGEPARCRPANEPTRMTRRLDPPVVDVACVPQDQPGSTPPVGVQPTQDKQ